MSTLKGNQGCTIWLTDSILKENHAHTGKIDDEYIFNIQHKIKQA